MPVQPYLFFNGRAEEAIDFYCETLGAKVTALMRFKEIPDADAGVVTPENENKIMHAALQIGESEIFVSDGRCHGELNFAGFSLTMSASSDDEAERVFGVLAENGTVQMPMDTSFFASRFGVVDDAFGVSWMILSGA